MVVLPRVRKTGHCTMLLAPSRRDAREARRRRWTRLDGRRGGTAWSRQGNPARRSTAGSRVASHTGCQLQVLGLLAGGGLDCIGCTACWASCTWTRTDRMKRYHIGDRLHRSFPLRLPLGPSLEAGSEDRTEDEDRPLFSIQLACGTHRLWTVGTPG